MDDLEGTVQKHVVYFCKILPAHVEKWKLLLQKVEKPVEVLSNYGEQLRLIQKATIKHLEEFTAIQKNLEYKIYEGIENEISTVRDIVDQLNAVNHETRNKLSLLERSTINLNWENDTELLRGNAVQPSLSSILQEGLDFWLYFSETLKIINNEMKNFNISDTKSMATFKNCFKIDLEVKVVNRLLSKTQYVVNEKLLV